MTAPAVILRELTIRYTSAADTVSPIQSFSAQIPAGSMTLLLGPSGCGKTSLLSALAGLLRPSSGTITVGEDHLTSMTVRNSTTSDAIASGSRSKPSTSFHR